LDEKTTIEIGTVMIHGLVGWPKLQTLGMTNYENGKSLGAILTLEYTDIRRPELFLKIFARAL
jgi:hypothetical protein